MNNKNISVKDLTLLGVFTALIILQTFVPNLGYIRFGLVDFTIIHVTVIVAACLLGWKNGLLMGGIWGVSSMLYAYSTPGLLNPLFYNPLISVAPRLLVGLFAALTFMLLKNRFNQTVSSIAAGIVGTLTNTVFVLSALYIFGYDFLFKAMNMTQSANDPVLTFILSLVTTNTLLEIAIAALVVPALVKPLSKLVK